MGFFALTSLAVFASIVAQFPDGKTKRDIVYHMNVIAFRMMCRSVSAIITYHDRENIPRSGGICVANHTTVIDAVILMQDRPYAILGQKHSGFLGWAMDVLSTWPTTRTTRSSSSRRAPASTTPPS